jgi:hypothetical protein
MLKGENEERHNLKSALNSTPNSPWKHKSITNTFALAVLQPDLPAQHSNQTNLQYCLTQNPRVSQFHL